MRYPTMKLWNRSAVLVAFGCTLTVCTASLAQQAGDDPIIRLKGIGKDLDGAVGAVQKNWLGTSREQKDAHDAWFKAVRAQNHVDPSQRSSREQIAELARVRDQKTEANNRAWQALSDLRDTRRDVREWIKAVEQSGSGRPRDIPPVTPGDSETLRRLQKMAQDLSAASQGGNVPDTDAIRIFRRHFDGDRSRPDGTPDKSGTPFFSIPGNPGARPPGAESDQAAPPRDQAAAQGGQSAAPVHVAPGTGASGSPESRTRLRCSDCGQWFYDSDMPLHLEAAHPEFFRDAPRDTRTERPAVVKHQSRCGVCGQMIDDDELARHVDGHRPRAQCPHCNETYYAVDLAAHIAARHPATADCPKCHKTYYQRDLARHMAAAHPTPPRSVDQSSPLAVEYAEKPYAVTVGAVNTITARFWNNTDRPMRAGAQLVTFNNNVSVSPGSEREFWIEPYSVSGWYNWQVTVRVAGEQTIQMNRRVIDN